MSNSVEVEISRAVFNPVYFPYLKDDRYQQIFFGGASSGKSVFLAQRAVIDLLEGKRNYLCVRKYKTDIRDSSFSEMVKFIEGSGLASLFHITKNPMRIICDNNCEAMFLGLDDREKIKSKTPQKGVYTDVWIEEATEVNKDDYKQLQKRLRGKWGKSKRITMSFNPILAGHWIEKEHFDNWTDNQDILEEDNKLILRTTYKDNKFLTEQDKELLEEEQDKYYYDVYTQGKWGLLGNIIFKNWEVKDLNRLKKNWSKSIYGGVDFGFSESPAAGLSVGYDRDRKIIYIFDECGGSGMTNEELARQLDNIRAMYFTADSAEPKSIKELQKEGVRCQGAEKGKDSVRYGIKWLQRHNIIIDESCRNFQREIPSYKWRETRSGEIVEQPVEKDDHWIDALRYAVEPIHNYELEGGGNINMAVVK